MHAGSGRPTYRLEPRDRRTICKGYLRVTPTAELCKVLVVRTCLENSTRCRKTLSTLPLALTTDTERGRVYHKSILFMADHGSCRSALLKYEHRYAYLSQAHWLGPSFTSLTNATRHIPAVRLLLKADLELVVLRILAKQKYTRVASSCTTASGCYCGDLCRAGCTGIESR